MVNTDSYNSDKQKLFGPSMICKSIREFWDQKNLRIAAIVYEKMFKIILKENI